MIFHGKDWLFLQGKLMILSLSYSKKAVEVIRIKG